MSWNPTDKALKVLLSRRATSPAKGINEEKGDTTIIVASQDIWADSVPFPPPASTTALVEVYGTPVQGTDLLLAQDDSVAGSLTWFATQDTAQPNDDSLRLKNFISDRFGAGYRVLLYDKDGVLIPETDGSKWLFDYATGVLTFQNGTTDAGSVVSRAPFSISGYRYIGQVGMNNAEVGEVEAIPNSTVLRDGNAMTKVAGPPTDAQHVVNKAYVDSYVSAGLTLKQPVRLLVTALALTAQGGGVYSTGSWNGEQSVTLTAGDRILRATPSGNVLDGIYVVNGANGSGGLLIQRSADADNTPDVGEVRGGMFCFVNDGTYANQGWVLATPNGIANLGTDTLNFVPFSGAGAFEAGSSLGRIGNTVFVSTNLNAGTGANIGTGNLLVGAGSDNLTELAAPSSDGQTWHLSITNGAVTWTKVNVANITGTLPIARGGTGTPTFTAGIVKSPGGTGALTTATPGTDYIAPTASALQTIHSASSDVLRVRGGTTAGNNVVLRVEDEAQDTGYSFNADGTMTAITEGVNTLLLNPGQGSLRLGYDADESMVPMVFATTGIQAFLDGSGGYLFSVDNSGNLFANSKSFNIPHPTKADYRLVYGCLEGPEHGVYHRGTAEGTATVYVELPDYWQALVEENYTVQLTGWGRSVVLVAKGKKGFWVKNEAFLHRDKTCQFDYVVIGSRKDAPLTVEQPAKK